MFLYNIIFTTSSHVPPLVPNPGLKYRGRFWGGSKGTTNWYLGVSSALCARAKMQSFLRGALGAGSE